MRSPCAGTCCLPDATPTAEDAVGLERRLAEAERQGHAPTARWLAELAGELAAALLRLAGEVAIERRADWLVLACRLVLLRSRAGWIAEDEAAVGAAAAVPADLPAAAWLAARPLLGHEVFTRPQRREPRSHSYFGLMQACLDLLRAPAAAVQAEAQARPAFWRVSDALGRIRALVGQHPAGASLSAFHPPDARSGVAARAMVASTFVAALELARDGSVALDQASPFGEVRLRPGA